MSATKGYKMEFQNKDCAYSYIEQLLKGGRRNILLSSCNSGLSETNRFNHLAFYEEDGFLLPYNSQGEIMSMLELKSMISFLTDTINNFNEDKSIKEEIAETYRYINKEYIPLESNKKPRVGHVYLMHGENNRYKIGYSKNVIRRISELKLSSCENHTLVHSYLISEPMVEEKRLHSMFKDNRKHSEWFELSDNDIAYIKGLSDEI
jgi:hypothetical protein